MQQKIIYDSILGLKKQGKKGFAVLVDPDKINVDTIPALTRLCNEAKVDYIFFGGSLVTTNYIDACIEEIKKQTNIPVVLFPGSPAQVSHKADALLYLSLISGRNPDLLIGAHVSSAAVVKSSGLEIISTGYMVIDGGAPTTVSYMSGSFPIPADKNDVAMCTALAGEMQGKHLIYMDAGSGAKNPISESMIKKVSSQIEIPLIIGGGITDPDKAFRNCEAGADIIVVGNAIEKDPNLILEISKGVRRSYLKG